MVMCPWAGSTSCEASVLGGDGRKEEVRKPPNIQFTAEPETCLESNKSIPEVIYETIGKM